MKIINLKCPNCGAPLNNVDKDEEKAWCDACHSEFILEHDRPVINQTIHNYYGDSAKPASPPRNPRTRFSVIMVSVMFIIICLAGILGPRLLSSRKVAEEEIIVYFPESKPALKFVSLVFQKPAESITAEELATIKYLDISYISRYASDYIWSFRYSFESYAPNSKDYQETIKTITFSSEDDILWEDIKSFSGLIYLDLNETYEIVKTGNHSDLKNLKDLKYYQGGFNQSISSPEEFFSDPAQLEELKIMIYSDMDVEAFSSFTHLKSLDISGFYDESGNYAKISDLQHLESLTLNNCPDISWLSGLTGLKKLSIESTSQDFSVLYGMPGLEELTIINCPLKEVGFVKNMPNLNKLTIDNTSIQSTEPLEGKISLMSLILTGNSDLSQYSSLDSLTSLEELHFYNNSSDSLSSFPELSELVNLKKVSISSKAMEKVKFAPSIIDLTLYSNSDFDCNLLIDGFSGIEKLSLQISDDILNTDVIAAFPALKELNFIGAQLMTEKGNSRLLSLPNIESLSFTNSSIYIESLVSEPNSTLKKLSFDITATVDYDNTVFPEQQLGDFNEFCKYFTGLTGLVELDLPLGKLSDLDFVSNLTALEKINIFDNNITDIAPLARLEHLKAVYCEKNSIRNLDLLPDSVAVYD